MKKETLVKFAGIGLFHAVLYLGLVPLVILPAFGTAGLWVAVAFALVVSAVVLAKLWLKKKGERPHDLN